MRETVCGRRHPEVRVDLRLWEARTLRGRILDAEGKPIAGASLLATKDYARFGFVPAEGTTDADGRFELSGVPIGDCGLRAWAPGFVFGEHTFWLTTDEETDLRLERGDGMQLRITTEGLPPAVAAAVQVFLYARSISMPRAIERPSLDADGTCVVKGLPELDWDVSLYHPDFRFEPASALVPRSKEPAPLHFVAARVARGVEPFPLRGQLLADDKPLAGQPLRLRAAGYNQRPEWPARVVTDAEGRFELATMLQAGDKFSLQIVGPHWALSQPKPPPKTRVEEFRRLAGLDLPDIRYRGVADRAADLRLTAVRAIPVHGRVVDTEGRGVPSVAVALQEGPRANRSPRYMTILSTTSRRDGSFEFEGVLAYDFDVRIRAFGQRVFGSTEPFHVIEGPAIEQDVTVGPTGHIEGVLTDKDAKLLGGWRMQIGSTDYDGPSEVMTDREGHYVFFGLPPGRYGLSTFRIGSPRQPKTSEQFEVNAGETVRRDLQWQ